MTKKNVVITGGSNGLGKAILQQMLSSYRGCDFNFYNIDKENSGFAQVCDIEIELKSTNMADDVDKLIGFIPEKIDILINNLGVNYIEFIPELKVFEFDKLMDLNVKIPYLLVKKLCERLRGGTILNIVSNASDMAMSNSLAYNMSKGAMKIGTKQIARELGKTHDITCFGISPNKLKNTKMTEYIDNKVCELRGWTPEEAAKYQCAGLPAGEETDPETLAEFIGFLLSTKQRHKYLQGCLINYGGPMGN